MQSFSDSHITRRRARLELTLGIVFIVVALVVTAIVVVNVWGASQGTTEVTPTETIVTPTKTAEPIDGQVYTLGGSHDDSFHGIFLDDEGVIYASGDVWVVIDKAGQVTFTETDASRPMLLLRDGFVGNGRYGTFFEVIDSISAVLRQYMDPYSLSGMTIAMAEDGTIAALGSNFYLLSADGTLLWMLNFYEEEGWRNKSFYDVAFFPDGSLCLVGYSNDGAAVWNAVILILDRLGNTVSLNKLVGSAASLSAVQASPDGTVVAVGSSSVYHQYSDAVVTKIDKSGDVLWIETFGGPDQDYFSDVAVDSSGGIFVVGASASRDGSLVERPANGVRGKRDAVIAHIDSDGSLVWAQLWAGSRYDELNSVAINGGRICAAGMAESRDGVFQDTWESGDGMVICLNQT